MTKEDTAADHLKKLAEAEKKLAEADALLQNNKPGTKTTEFWKSILVHVVALVIMLYGAWKGSDTLIGIGGVLMGGTAGAYSLSRGLSKIRTQGSAVAGLLLACTLSLCLAGCGGPGYIRAAGIDGTLRRVITRHQAYVSSDVTLIPLERRANLRDGEIITKVLDEAANTGE